MARQLTTALSDLVLAISSLWGFKLLSEKPGVDFQFGKWWFMLLLLAATLGALKFGELLPKFQTGITKYHTNFSWLCRAIGVPCLAAEVCKFFGHTVLGQGFLLSAVATFITSSLRSQHKERVTLLINGLSIIMILVLSIAESNYNLAMAGVMFVVSAIVGAEGEIAALKLLRIDLFHYALVGVNFFIVKGFL